MTQHVPVNNGWRALAGTAVGYAIATGLIFTACFLVPYAIVRSI